MSNTVLYAPQATSTEVEEPQHANLPIAECVSAMVRNYIATPANQRPESGLYDGVILPAMERPLLEVAMEAAHFNQSRAASILGLSRGTTRKKLIQHFGYRYCKAFPDERDDRKS